MTEQGRLGAPEQNAGRSSDSFVTVYLNSLPGLYAMLSQEKKRDLELNVRGWLLSTFQSDLDQKVARAFDTKDFGPLPVVQEFVKFMPQLFQLYMYGMYYSTIALAGVTAERLCLDLLHMADIQVDKRTLSNKKKQAIARMHFVDLIDLLSKWKIIKGSTKRKLHAIRKTRNKYLHPRQPPFQTEKADAKHLVELTCEIAKNEFGPGGSGRYTFQDGALVLRPRQAETP